MRSKNARKAMLHFERDMRLQIRQDKLEKALLNLHNRLEAVEVVLIELGHNYEPHLTAPTLKALLEENGVLTKEKKQ